MEYAENELALSVLQPDGATLRQHYESLQRQSGKDLPELEPVDVPAEALYLWEDFAAMNRRRTSNGFGPNPISNAEVASFSALHGFSFSPWEMSVLDRLEIMYLNIKNKPKEESAS